MEKIVLENGVRVIFRKSSSQVFTINVAMCVGSRDESKISQGISHFIEHMLFEGTKKRTAIEIASAVEKYGAEFNAYTTSEKTNFYIKIPIAHAVKAIEILADILCNPKFDKKTISKEKNVVLEEIDMVRDDPKMYQWVLFQQHLFKGALSFPTSGTKETVSSFTKQDLESYHSKFYVGSNAIITIVAQQSFLPAVKEFMRLPKGKANLRKATLTNIKKEKYEQKKVSQKYLVIGHISPPRSNWQSYAMDIASAILSRGQSGRLFKEIRTKRGLTYDFGVVNHPSTDHGIFAFYASAAESKISQVEKIYFNQLKSASKAEIEVAISFIEGDLIVKSEDSHNIAELVSFYEECEDVFDADCYIQKLKKVSIGEVNAALESIRNAKSTKILLTPNKA